MRYEGRVFRPPSEAYSLIVQGTIGCSYNRCYFCDMYREKRFRIRPTAEILADLTLARSVYSYVRRIFIADGDALIMKTKDWEEILLFIRATFPECDRVSTYGSPGSILFKSEAELSRLRELGLSLIYLGLESGSDIVLSLINKGFSADEIITAGQKVKAAGIPLSVTAISGLGGQALIQEHAKETARALSAMKPEYIGILTLLVEEGTPLAHMVADGNFILLSATEVMEETRLLLQEIDSEGSVFRTNHASNYLALKGTLNADRDEMIAALDKALSGGTQLKYEFFRAL